MNRHNDGGGGGDGGGGDQNELMPFLPNTTDRSPDDENLETSEGPTAEAELARDQGNGQKMNKEENRPKSFIERMFLLKNRGEQIVEDVCSPSEIPWFLYSAPQSNEPWEWNWRPIQEIVQRCVEDPDKIVKNYTLDKITRNGNILHFIAYAKMPHYMNAICNIPRIDKSKVSKALQNKDSEHKVPLDWSVNDDENTRIMLQFVLDRPEDFSLQELTLFSDRDDDDTQDADGTENKSTSNILDQILNGYINIVESPTRYTQALMSGNQETLNLFKQIFLAYCKRVGSYGKGVYRLTWKLLAEFGYSDLGFRSRRIKRLHIKTMVGWIPDTGISQESFFQFHTLFQYKNITTGRNILMDLAALADDEWLYEFLVCTDSHQQSEMPVLATHECLKARDREGQTLFSIIEAKKGKLPMSLQVVLNKEIEFHKAIAVHVLDSVRACVSSQLSSSAATYYIMENIAELLEPVSSLKKIKAGFKIFLITGVVPFLLFFFDVFSDIWLAVEYSDQYKDHSFVETSKDKCAEAVNSTFNSGQEHRLLPFNHCFSASARLALTIIFVCLPFLFNGTEFWTLADEYEVSGIRSRLRIAREKMLKEGNSASDKARNFFKFLCFLVVSVFVVVFWKLVITICECVNEYNYETARDAKVKEKERKKKSLTYLTASRGNMIEVAMEATFQPIIQVYLLIPAVIAGRLGNILVVGDDFIDIRIKFSRLEFLQLLSILMSMVTLAWGYSGYLSRRKNGLLGVTISPLTSILVMVIILLQILVRMLAFQLFAVYLGPGNYYPLIIFLLAHITIAAVLHTLFSEDWVYLTECRFWKYLHNTLLNACATIYMHNYIRSEEIPLHKRSEKEWFDYETKSEKEVNWHNSQIPGLQMSTFIRQLAFESLYLAENSLLFGLGFSSETVQNGVSRNALLSAIIPMVLISFLFKILYYLFLHLRSDIIMKSKLREVDTESPNYKKYELAVENTWVCGKLTPMQWPVPNCVCEFVRDYERACEAIPEAWSRLRGLPSYRTHPGSRTMKTRPPETKLGRN